MTLDEFIEGCSSLIERGKIENVAFMCCECQWWRCHRSMIADYLAFRKIDCQHIMPHVRQKNKVKEKDKSKNSRDGNSPEAYHFPFQ